MQKITMENDDNCVCMSLSTDRIAGTSDDDDIFTEEVVEDEGASELVLVPRRQVRQKDGLWEIVLDNSLHSRAVNASSKCMRKSIKWFYEVWDTQIFLVCVSS